MRWNPVETKSGPAYSLWGGETQSALRAPYPGLAAFPSSGAWLAQRAQVATTCPGLEGLGPRGGQGQTHADFGPQSPPSGRGRG